MMQEMKMAKDSAGNILRSCWKPDGKKVDQAFQGKLRAWMKNNNIPDSVPITVFLRAKEYAKLREKAIQFDKEMKDALLQVTEMAKDNEANVLRQQWKPDGKTIDVAFQEKLKEWLGKNNLPADLPITVFLRAQIHLKSRQKALKDLS